METPPEVTNKSQTRQELEWLEREVSQLEALSEALFKRLGFVYITPPPQATPGQKDVPENPVRSDLASMLAGKNDRIKAVRRSLETLIGGLDL